MIKFKFNISKEYFVANSGEDVSAKLVDIISASFKESEYALYGKISSVNPLAFLLMAKWYSFGRPLFPEFASTKLNAFLSSKENETVIKIKTETNIIFYFPLVFLLLLLLITVIENGFYFRQFGNFILALFFLFAIDRLMKLFLISFFERDLFSSKTGLKSITRI